MKSTTSYRSLFDLFWSQGLSPFLVLAALLVSFAAYQVPVAGREALGSTPSPVGFAAVYPPEATPHGFQRWTTDWTRVSLPGVGPQPILLRLRFFAGDASLQPRHLVLATLERQLAELELRSEWQEVELYLPAGSADPQSGDLHLVLQATPLLNLPADERQLGIALHWLAVQAPSPAFSLQFPPWSRVAQLALVLLATLWCLRLVGFSSRQAALPLLLLLGYLGSLMGGGLNQELGLRMQAALALPLLLQVLSLTLPLAMVLRLLPWLRNTGQEAFPAGALVRLAVLLIFSMRLLGLLHPQFVPVDHGLRANQLILIANGQAVLVRTGLEQQHEWGTRDPVPYSLLTYYMLLPLTLLWDTMHTLVAAVKVVTALLEASFPLLFLALLRDSPQRRMAAAWASIIYAGLPVGFLFFHDGSFPTTIGIWLSLLALVALQWLLNSPPTATWLRGSVATLGVALAIGAYVTHIAFVPFLGGVLALSLVLLGGSHGPMAGRRVFATFALGLLVGWIMVYGSYTMTLIQRTIPSYLGLIVSEGSVGRDTEAFFGTPINSFGQHLSAHFRVWPIVLAGGALVALSLNWRERFITHLGLAYAIFFSATSIAENWFGLWNKHMVFAAPGVALLAGIGMAWLWQRGRAARWVGLSLLAYLFWEVLIAWGNRALWYQLPPSAL
ncbi:MAG: hypothetical protein EI684_09455 [Candidatus Viridilinea halotolerans]|uniref:Uncharacterized protein n=1 Tax=Candidatus Viridilinea halotolerans TaxID=2491704 RepID=A0A426U134_9CHLR|nr:MAG: hypothetical protein EI684_09455 [Candidatus Viridilinea halotolerans]